MSMSDAPHDALIDVLASGLRPVRRLSPPALRALLWLGLVALIATALALVTDLDGLERRLAAAPDLWLAVLGSTLTAIGAALAAFELSVPDRRATWAMLPIPPLLLWIGASGLGCLRGSIVPGTHVAPLSEASDCLLFILGLSVPLGGALFLLLRHGFALRPGLTAAIGGLAVAAAAATLLNFFHPFDTAATDLAVHAVAVALVIGVSRLAAGRALPR